MGSITQIVARTTRAAKWLRKNLQTESWQWSDDMIVNVDSRYAEQIRLAIQEEF